MFPMKSVFQLLAIAGLVLLSHPGLAQTNPPAANAGKPASEAPQAPAVLPGKGLAQHDFFYAGEAKEERMSIVRGGQVVWSYTHPGRGEISDAVLEPNGNILFAHQYGITEITPDKKVVWNFDAPAQTEIHTAQPIGANSVWFIQNGNPAQFVVIDKATGKIEHQFELPVKNPGSVHGQFRQARLTAAGTILVAHMDSHRVVEYDLDGKVLWSHDVTSCWSAKPLANGNVLIAGAGEKFVREINRKGETVWEWTAADAPEYSFSNVQTATRLPNGNTIVNNWFNQWSDKLDPGNAPVQAIEVTPDKKVVWALRAWSPPADLGPSTTIQILDEPPTSWIDPATGHRVVRLTREPGSASLYFNQNGYTADGKKLVYSTPGGISVLDLATREARQIVPGRARLIEAGRKTQRIYYAREGAVFSTDADTGETRRIGALPPGAGVATVNADETLLAGAYVEGGAQEARPAPEQQLHPLDQPANKAEMMERRWAARLPMVLFTLDVRTGEIKTIHRSNDWLGHLLFSPTDPTLLMFCHEGPWHKVDRIWTIRADGSGLHQIHTRTMAMEIFGHEFWSADGKTIWYDLQTPRGEDFWLAGYNIDSGARTWYHLQRDEWSIHFNVSRDGALFCGDGGDPGQVAKAPDGEWIYLFRPETIEKLGLDDKGFVQPGVLRSERLVNMSKHGYRLEPNVSFTPDGKWVVFRSNMFGPVYVFAVEVAKTG
jgi:oligogalacturonide lyase